MPPPKIDLWPYLAFDCARKSLHEDMMTAKAIADPAKRRLAEKHAWGMYENAWRTYLRDTANRH